MYTITDLGAMYPNAMNDRGDIVGQSYEGRAVVLFKGKPPRYLGWGTLTGINKARQAVGMLENGGIFWSPQTGVVALPIEAPGAITEPLAIGPDGTIVGRSWLACEDWGCERGPQAMVILPEANAVSLLPGLGGWECVAYAVNQHRVVTGSSWLPDSQLHAMRCTVDLGCEDLGTLGNVYSEGFGINWQDEIVGASHDNEGEWGVLRAFIYTDSGGMQPLGFFSNWAYSVAYATNSKRQRVGFAWKGTGDNSHPIAVLWKPNGSAVNLQNGLVNGSGWELREADAINTGGEIVGVGLLQGQERGFLLTPVPTSASAVGD
jgi:uncharacterized membrane protein